MGTIRSNSRCLAVFFALWLPCLSSANDIPNGWDRYIDKKKNAVVFQPSSTDVEVDILVKYYPAAPLHGKVVDVWLRNKLANSKAPRGIWREQEQVERQNANLASGYRRFINSNGSIGILQANVLSINQQFAHLAVVIFTQNEKNLAYQDGVKAILANFIKTEIANTPKEERNWDPDIFAEAKTKIKSQKKTREKTQKERRETIEAAIRVAPGRGVDSSDIEVVWVYNRIDLIWGGIDVDTYLLLEDGSVYRDCEIPPNELNVVASKKLQPEKWSVWRASWGDYQIKDEKDGSWKDLKGSPGGMADIGSKIAGKYVNAGGSQFKGSWKKTMTFNEDGTFELTSFAIRDNSEMGGGEDFLGSKIAPLVTSVNSSDKTGTSGATSVIGDNVGGGDSSKVNDGLKNTGQYQIGEYSITLIHDNGWKHTEFFIYEDRTDTRSFVYGNDMYYFDDE